MLRNLFALNLVFLFLFVAGCPGSGGSSGPAIETDAGDAVESDADGESDLSNDGTLPDPDGGCVPVCDNKECGSDSCGGQCGICTEGAQCVNSKCVEESIPCEELAECYPHICDADTGKCGPCTTDDQCSQGGGVCDEQAGLCEECVEDNDCGEFEECQNNGCVELPCPASPCPDGLVCDESNAVCVECVIVDDCPPNYTCEANLCIAPATCDSSKDCADDEVCFKDEGICVECVEDADCADGWRCSEAHECYEVHFCDSDKDCKDYDMVCDKELGECVDCLSDLDCADDHYCEGAACLDDVCDQDAEWPACLDNAVGACSENGAVFVVISQCLPEEFCVEAECVPWLCPPGESGCSGDVAYECKDDGSGYVWEEDCAAAEAACSGGECKEVVCEMGVTYCLDPLTLVHCLENGTDFDTTPCGDGEFCQDDEGLCAPWVCEPGVPECDGGAAVTCDEFGSGWGTTTDCEALGQVCAAGECVDCDPQCGNKECGEDACGGVCGVCADDEVCTGAGSCLGVNCAGECSGQTAAALTCGLDLCYPTEVGSAEVVAPLGDNISTSWQVEANWGNAGNDLQPKNGPTFVVLSTGNLSNPEHNDNLPPGNASMGDPFTNATAHDVIQAKLTLSAPIGVTGFSVDFLFTSAEFTGTNQPYNDKFYLVLNAPQTTGGEGKVINYVECVNPQVYTAFEEGGVAYCYLGAIADLEEDPPQTKLGGTGFQTSTGWMRTVWPIQAGETFTLNFHLQDTNDGLYDTAIALDNFQWLSGAIAAGTNKL